MERIDPRKMLRGYDGALYTGDGDLLVEVNEFTAAITVASTDYQPAKSRLSLGLTTGYSVALTFTEAVIRDAILLKKMLDHVTGADQDLDFEFTGILEGYENNGVYVFRACEPDGTINIMGVSSGDLITRPWSFRVNEVPDLQSILDAGAIAS